MYFVSYSMLALPNKEVTLQSWIFPAEVERKFFGVSHGSRQNDDPISPIRTLQLAHTVASVALTGTASSSEWSNRVVLFL